MRLSATDRIIREAEQQDDAAVEAGEHPDTEKVSATPFVALGIPAPRMPTPLGGGIDIDIEDADGLDDEEGETQVDAKRSAAALNEMRALQAKVQTTQAMHTPPPATTRRSNRHRPRGLPPGRPAGTGLTPMPALIAPSASPTAWQPDDNRPDHMFSSSRIQFGAIALPPTAITLSGLSPAPRRPGRVGRRTGIAIAASTAMAVALIAGAWTAKNSAPVRTVIARPSSMGLVRGATAATPPRPAISPVVIATAPAPAAAPEPTEAPPAPVAPEAATPPAPLTEAAESSPIPTTTPTRAAPLSKRAQAAAAKKAAIKARVAKKKAALAAAVARRRAKAHKPAKAAVSAPAAASARAPAARPTEAPRGRNDPDDTLPITD